MSKRTQLEKRYAKLSDQCQMNYEWGMELSCYPRSKGKEYKACVRRQKMLDKKVRIVWSKLYEGRLRNPNSKHYKKMITKEYHRMVSSKSKFEHCGCCDYDGDTCHGKREEI